MRLVHWLFVLSAAFFVSGIGFIVASARARPAEAAAVEAIPLTPVASMKQIMSAIVTPAAYVVFDSVSTIVDAGGVHEKQPRTDEEWTAVGASAAALIEASNLLLMGDRAVDRGDWVTMAKAMAEAGQQALKAADAKDAEGILAAGEVINESCDNCHAKYQR